MFDAITHSRTSSSVTNRHTEARERGFTMIELLVVCIVTAVISAISIPVYLKHRTNAKEDSVAADARQAGVALSAQATGSGMIPSNVDTQGAGIWNFKPSAPNTVVEYKAQDTRFRICVANTTATPRAWAYYESVTNKVLSGTGTEPTGACDGNTAGPALPVETVRGPSTPIPTPEVVTESPAPATPTATPTPPPAAPTGLAVQTTLGENRGWATWNTVTAATKYSLYLDGAATPVWSGTTNAVYVNDLTNGPHTLVVTASKNSSESDPSTEASFTVTSNDNYVDAMFIGTISPTSTSSIGGFLKDVSNATATSEAGEAEYGEHSLWYYYTAASTYPYRTFTMTVVPNSSGAPVPADLRITAYSTTSTTVPSTNPGPPSELTPVASNAMGDPNQPVQFLNGGNKKVLVRVSGPNVGKFALRVIGGPTIDYSSGGLTLSTPALNGAPVGIASHSNNWAGREPSENGTGLASMWYKVRTPASAGYLKAEVVAPTSGTLDFTPEVTIFNTINSGNDVAGARDKRVSTFAEASVTASTTYMVRVAVAPGDTRRGSYGLNVSMSSTPSR